MNTQTAASQIPVSLHVLKSFTLCVSLSLTILFLSGTTNLNAEANLLGGEEILKKFVEATGGKEAYEKIYNRVVTGTFEIPQGGLHASVTTYSARPNKMYVCVESKEMGKIEKGTNGEVAWDMTTMGGPRLLEGQEKEDYLREATFDRFVTWKTVYSKAECTGIDDIDGRQCFKVIMTPKSGNPQTFFFDTKSYLIVKSETTFSLQTGDVLIESYGFDYKEVDGILIAHTSKTFIMGQERIMVTESIEHNVEFQEDPFILPDEIQALVNRNKRMKDKP